MNNNYFNNGMNGQNFNVNANPQGEYNEICYEPAANKESLKKKSAKKIVALALCFSLLGGAVGTGSTLAVLNNSESSSVSTSSKSDTSSVINTAAKKNSVTLTQTKTTSGEKLTASQVYANNVNSTVGITTEINTNYFGYQTTAAASGSGFIVTADGYVVTNYHVIDGASSIKVTTYDNKSYDAKLIGSDESNDIAVLKIDADGLTPVTLGNSEELSVGDDVVAIGNPLGELTFTLTSGVVSALDREITTENSNMMNLIQTDCAINSGNSGGALFNMYGEVIGVTNAKYSSNSSSEASIDNIGFAIPIDTVKTIVTSIIENGYVVKPYIGVSLSDTTENSSSKDSVSGAVVRSVTENSPAAEAGLKENDIITKANDKQITSSSDLASLVKKSSKGDKLELTVNRDGKEIKLTVTVDEQKQDAKTTTDSSNTTTQENNQNSNGMFGGRMNGEDFDFGGNDRQQNQQDMGIPGFSN